MKYLFPEVPSIGFPLRVREHFPYMVFHTGWHDNPDSLTQPPPEEENNAPVGILPHSPEIKMYHTIK